MCISVSKGSNKIMHKTQCVVSSYLKLKIGLPVTKNILDIINF